MVTTEVDTSTVYFIHSGSSYSCAQFGVIHERRAYEYKNITDSVTYEGDFLLFSVSGHGKSPLGMGISPG